jgi:GTP pyrophosphokinase
MAERTEAPPAESKNSDSAPASARVRNRLARIGGKSGSLDAVLDPLIKVYRATHPKGDVSSIQKAYEIAERMHEGQTRKSTRSRWPRSSPSSA